MKNNYRILYLLVILPIIVTIIMLFVLPDQIPAHYDFNGDITRWGSKYESLISPVITILMGLFWKVIAKVSIKEDKKLKSKNLKAGNEKIIVITGIATLILFNIINYLFLYKAYFEATQSSKPIQIELYKVVGLIMGLIFVVLGYIIPKCKLNSLIGIRTSWSMANEKAWCLSQRMGGVSLVIAGIISIVGSLFFVQKLNAIIFPVICSTISVIWSIIYSKIAYQKSIKE